MPTPTTTRHRGAAALLRSWFDSHTPVPDALDETADRIEWLRIIPFAVLHLGCFGVVFVGVSPFALAFCVAAYAVRMFAITAFCHRYFSHRSFRTSRAVQFVFAFLGNSSGQRGPLWWAAHHRKHHKHADTDRDPHSPSRHGFLWSHVFWFTTRRNFPTALEQIPDFARFPELRLLDRFDVLAPLAFGIFTDRKSVV